ncbi:MAG: hypothetical protein Q7S23_05505 [bacterium]|nr:hypothetical protein [bacterium]
MSHPTITARIALVVALASLAGGCAVRQRREPERPLPRPVPLPASPTPSPTTEPSPSPQPSPRTLERIITPVPPGVTWSTTKATIIARLQQRLEPASNQPFILRGVTSQIVWLSAPRPLPVTTATLSGLGILPRAPTSQRSDNVRIAGENAPNSQYGNYHLQHIGDFTGGTYQGYQAVLLSEEGMGTSYWFFARHAATGQGTLLLQFPFDSYDVGEQVYPAGLRVDATFSFPDLAYPNTITLPVRDADEVSTTRGLALHGRETGFFEPIEFSAANLDLVAPATALGDLYYSQGHNGFAIAAPSGHVIFYAPLIPFELPGDSASGGDAHSLRLTWNYGNPTTEYVSMTRGGCGSSNYRDIAEDVAPADLVAAGIATTDGGTALPIYEFADENHPNLRTLYDERFIPFEERKPTYDEFLATHPLFFWPDELGRLVRFTAATYIPQAECAKPAIYLYPTKTQPISVLVSPRGGFTHTEPPYGNGWHVVATPDGRLTDVPTGTPYPYLWWDGRGGLYQPPEHFWVVAQPDVEPFLRRTLPQLGLSATEIRDFLEYWLPFFTPNRPYYRIGFHGTAVMNELAPLDVQPQPDTIIRILMDYAGLTARETENPPQIVTPQRHGFTLIEWGGVRR